MPNHSSSKEYLEMILLAFGILSFIYQIARLEHKIFTAIDEVKDVLVEKFTYLNSELRIHITECNQIRKNTNYALRELKNRTDNLSDKWGGK